MFPFLYPQPGFWWLAWVFCISCHPCPSSRCSGAHSQVRTLLLPFHVGFQVGCLSFPRRFLPQQPAGLGCACRKCLRSALADAILGTEEKCLIYIYYLGEKSCECALLFQNKNAVMTGVFSALGMSLFSIMCHSDGRAQILRLNGDLCCSYLCLLKHFLYYFKRKL